MTHDEAMARVMAGDRITAPHMGAGQYLELVDGRVIRAWPVDRPEDEWQRSVSRFEASEIDLAADWSIVEVSPFDSQGNPLVRPVQPSEEDVVPGRVRRSRWGKTSEAAALVAIEQKRGKK